MDKSINLALIGASGVVGKKILQLLEKKNIKRIMSDFIII